MPTSFKNRTSPTTTFKNRTSPNSTYAQRSAIYKNTYTLVDVDWNEVLDKNWDNIIVLWPFYSDNTAYNLRQPI